MFAADVREWLIMFTYHTGYAAFRYAYDIVAPLCEKPYFILSAFYINVKHSNRVANGSHHLVLGYSRATANRYENDVTNCNSSAVSIHIYENTSSPYG